MKDENNKTRKNILDAARKEFFEKDYQNASLRNISKNAGVTTGAFYGYFVNKEELFDALVGEEYQHLIELYRGIIIQFFHVPAIEQPSKMVEHCFDGVYKMLDYIYDHMSEFQLILCHARGTKYENLTHTMAQLDIHATHEFVKNANEHGGTVKGADDTVEHIITTGMFSAMFELVIHEVPKEKALQYATTLIEFYHAGWKKIMGF